MVGNVKGTRRNSSFLSIRRGGDLLGGSLAAAVLAAALTSAIEVFFGDTGVLSFPLKRRSNPTPESIVGFECRV
jgi:hypothetical protein